MKACFAALLLPVVLLAGTTKNLVPNGDFETLDKDGYFQRYSRVPEWGGSGIKNTSFLPDSNAYKGNFSARYSNSGAGGFISYRSIPPLEPGKTYRFSAMMKTSLDPVMETSQKANPPPGAFISLMPVLPANWRGAWPKIGLPRLYAGGGEQDWKKYTGYFVADKTYNKVWFGIYIMSVKGTAWFDEIELVESTPEEAKLFAESQKEDRVADSENLLFNGSFELAGNKDFPDYLYSGIGCAWFEKEWKSKLIKAQNAPHGKHYFHIAGRYAYISTLLNTDPARPLMISFYAKSDIENQKGTASFNKNTYSFTPTKEWKRYSFPAQGGSKKRLTIGTANGKGSLDLDALMVHYGSELASYLPAKDEDIFRKIEEERQKPFFAPDTKKLSLNDEISASKTIDGNINGDFWKNSVYTKIQGTPSTEFALRRSGAYLYCAIRCDEPQMDKLKVHPGGKSWTVPFDDSVSLALIAEPEKENKNYYTFTVNTNGSRLAEHSMNKAVDVPWEAAVLKQPKGWTAEFKIPLAILTGNNMAGSEWGLNIGRNRPETPGRTRLSAFWNGKTLTDFGCLDMKKTFYPAASFGDMQFIQEKNRSLEFCIRADVQQGLSWKLRLSSGKEYKGNLSNGKLSFAGLKKLDLAGEKNLDLIAENAKGEMVCWKKIEIPEKLPAIQSDFRYEVVFKGEGNFFRSRFIAPEKELANIPVTIHFKNATGAVTEEKFPASKLQKGVWAGKNLQIGEYTVEMSMNWNSGKTAEKLPWSFKVYEKPATWTRVDRFAGMAEIDGKPYFPCALGFAWAWRYREFIPNIAETGFNTVLIWSADRNERMNPKKLMESYDLAKKNSLHVIQHTPTSSEENEKKFGSFMGQAQQSLDSIIGLKKDAVNQFKAHEAIRMWTHYDEIYGYWEKPPVPKKESDLAVSQKVLRGEDPMRLHWNNSTMSNRLYGGAESTDIVSATIYTIRNNGGAAETINAGAGLAQVGAKLGGKPSIAGIWLQFYSGDGEVGSGSREPTAEEMKCMMYGCMIRGIRAFWYFNQRPRSTILWEETGKCIKEIDSFKEVLAYGKEFPFASSHTSVIGTGYEYKGKIYIFTANTSYVPVKGAFTLPPGFNNGSGTLLFENRNCTFKNHSVTDAWKPLERHVYVFGDKK